MLRDRAALSIGQAAALGLAQGPTELLPLSSSAHTTLIPMLAGWPYGELDARLRKSFEVALHAGAAAALVIDMRAELLGAARELDRARACMIVLSTAPPALAGYALQGVIERRSGDPRAIARGLAAGAVAMAIADLRRGERTRVEAGAVDGLALGVAQALALAPGVSRNGAALTAARARGFRRRDAQALSWHAALPVLAGASALRAAGAVRSGLGRGAPAALAAGAAAAFCSTLASARLLDRARGRRLLPYALYRCLLAAVVLRRTGGRRLRAQ